MKRLCLSLIGVFLYCISSAQLYVSSACNYTMYRGGFKRSTPGIQVKAGYGMPSPAGISLSYTYGFPLRSLGTMEAYGNNQNIKIRSETTYRFKTFHFGFTAGITGDKYTKGALYASLGLEYVSVDINEKPTEAYDQRLYPNTADASSGKEDGIFANGGLGYEYRIGRGALFAEAMIAYPVGSNDDVYVSTNVPVHFLFNTGFKIKLTN